MVLARGIDYFIIIIEPHDPWFEEELAYIKQRRSFGLSIFGVFEYLKIWSIGFSVLKRLIYKGEVRSELAKGDLLSTSSDLSIWGYFSPSSRYAEAPKVQCVGTQRHRRFCAWVHRSGEGSVRRYAGRQWFRCVLSVAARGAIILLGAYFMRSTRRDYYSGCVLSEKYAARYCFWVRTLRSSVKGAERGHAVQKKEICGYTQRSRRWTA